jgi:hypothetical protein
MEKEYAPFALYFENLASIERMKAKNFMMECHEYVEVTWRRGMMNISRW